MPSVPIAPILIAFSSRGFPPVLMRAGHGSDRGVPGGQSLDFGGCPSRPGRWPVKNLFPVTLVVVSEGPKLGEPGREAWSIWVKAMEILKTRPWSNGLHGFCMVFVVEQHLDQTQERLRRVKVNQSIFQEATSDTIQTQWLGCGCYWPMKEWLVMDILEIITNAWLVSNTCCGLEFMSPIWSSVWHTNMILSMPGIHGPSSVCRLAYTVSPVATSWNWFQCH